MEELKALPLLHRRYILGMPVDATSYEDATNRVRIWAQNRLSKYVCIATVNNVMESYDSPLVNTVMGNADLVTPDGMPLVWGLGALGVEGASRCYGPDLTPKVLAMAEREGLPVGFYGGSQQVLDALQTVVKSRFPKLRIDYALSPPFRPLTPEEDRDVVQKIADSGIRILFIGLNSPKQDIWMYEHRGRVDCVMLGVGAAFDFLAGTKPQAPRWMMAAGLEWIFRLATEPKRLWKRYLKHNPRFVALFALQLLRQNLTTAKRA